MSTLHGYFLIADITGYTSYLSKSELDHAQQTLTALLNLLIKHTKPPLVISRLAGDAVISYGLRDKFFQGQTFVEMIEDTYVAFRRAINLMVLNTTCPCNACKNIKFLDLKFFIHYGTFGIQKLDMHDEMVGADVIAIHRLLKNTVTEKTGIRAYALYTDAAIRQLGIEDFCTAMTEHLETYEHIGEVKTWVQDMHPVWETKKESLKIDIPPDQAIAQESATFPVSVEVMWDVITDPRYRSLLMDAVRQNIVNRQSGRIAPGSQYQCFHGDGRETMQTILDWHPFDQMTTEDTTPVPKATCLINLRLEPAESGARLTATASKASGPWLNRKMCDLVAKFILPKTFATGLAKMAKLLEEDLAAGKYAHPEPVSFPVEQINQAVRENPPPV